jgi:hypothetical protein
MTLPEARPMFTEGDTASFDLSDGSWSSGGVTPRLADQGHLPAELREVLRSMAQDSGTSLSIASSQTRADMSDGARQSPRGDNAPPDDTLGPFGSAERLN